MYYFRMNANEEQTQIHTTYSKYIYFWDYTSLSEWMQLRNILNCTQLTQDAITYNMIHSFQMNAIKKHTQSHTTYLRCIILQALSTYYYFSFFLFLFFLVLIHYWKASIICIMAIVSLRLLKTLRNLSLNPYYFSLKHS